MAPTRSVLVVDDSPETRDIVARALSDVSWAVESAPNTSAAEPRMDRGQVDVLLTGLGTSPGDDVRTLRRIRRRHPKAKVIVLADAHAPDSIIGALKEHAFSYFSKPFSDEEIRAMVERALEEPDWNDGIQVLSDKPDWITVRASCRQLTADRLLKLLDELSVDLTEDDRKNTGAAVREILMNAIEHGGQFDPPSTSRLRECVRLACSCTWFATRVRASISRTFPTRRYQVQTIQCGRSPIGMSRECALGDSVYSSLAVSSTSSFTIPQGMRPY